MVEFLLNNCITLMFLSLITFISVCEYKKYLEKHQMTGKQFRSNLRTKFNETGRELFPKLYASLAIAVVISVVSFREMFLMDVFHTVFFTMIMIDPATSTIKKMFK